MLYYNNKVIYLETNRLRQRKRYLKAEAIIKYFQGNDILETEIMCSSSKDLVTSDQSLYEALGSFEDKSLIDLNKLVKFLEVVEVVSYKATFKQEKKILTPERVDQLNKLAPGKLMLNDVDTVDNDIKNTITNNSDEINNNSNNENNKLDTKKENNKLDSKEENKNG